MADFETLKNSTTDYFKNFDYKGYFKTLINLAVNPKEQWETIKLSNPGKIEILKSFILPSVLISIVVHIIDKLVGTFVPLGFYLASDIMIIANYFILALVIFYIAKIKYFEADVTEDASYQITGYVLSLVTLFSAAITLIAILLGFFSYIFLPFVLYALYVAYIGFEKLTSVNLKPQYFASVVIALIVASFIISGINSKLFMSANNAEIQNEVREKLKELNLDGLQNTLKNMQK